MTISETRSAGETATVHLDEPVPVHPDSLFKGRDDRDGAPEQWRWDFQDFTDPSLGARQLFSKDCCSMRRRV